MPEAQPDIIARIEAAMEAQGVTQSALAEKVGMSKPQISRLLSRQRKLTATELSIFAEQLGVSAAALLGEREPQMAVAARLGRAERAEDLAGPFARAAALLELRDLLDRVMDRSPVSPAPTLPRPRAALHKDQGRELALSLRKAFGLGSEAVEDLEGLAEIFNLDVSTQPLPPDLHGLLVAPPPVGELAAGAGPGGAIALLNARDNLGKRRFTLAHELGHLLFGDAELAIADYRVGAAHPDGRWTLERLVELRADYFAAHLLAPDDSVRAVAGSDEAHDVEGLPGGTALVVALAARLGVSFEVAKNRAKDVGLISEQQKSAIANVGAYEAFAGTRFAGRREVLDASVVALPPSAMLAQALTAYQEQTLGLRPLATLYDLSEPEDLDGLRTQLHDAGWAPGSSQT